MRGGLDMIDEISANSAPFFTRFKWARSWGGKLPDVTNNAKKF